jgi:hypothetical protein
VESNSTVEIMSAGWARNKHRRRDGRIGRVGGGAGGARGGDCSKMRTLCDVFDFALVTEALGKAPSSRARGVFHGVRGLGVERRGGQLGQVCGGEIAGQRGLVGAEGQQGRRLSRAGIRGRKARERRPRPVPLTHC